MRFIKLHIGRKPVYVEVSGIKQIHPAVKGHGSFLVTDVDSDLGVDESQEQVLELLEELEIEVDLYANDSE